MKAPTTQGHIQLQHVLKMVFGLRDYHLEQVREIINKADYHSPIYEKLKDIEAQISTGKVQYVKTYVVKTLQNEFGNVEDNKSYSSPESIRKQLQAAHSSELSDLGLARIQVEERPAGGGLGSIGEHIAKVLPQKPTESQ